MAMLLGGLGLFLLGMTLMTEGLKLAGGGALQGLLQRWTSTRPMAFLTGFAATALVQSSSAVAVILLGLLLTLVFVVQDGLNLDPNPAVSLAIFHTLFNLIGALLMIPLEGRLRHWLSGLFVSASERVSQPQFLDRATAESPDRALKALMLEERRLLGLAGQVALDRSMTEEQVHQQLQSLRSAAQSREISMRSMESSMRYLSTLRRIVRQYAKALRALSQLTVSPT